MLPEPCVWVFTGSGAAFPGGVFTSQERAEAWIATHGLTGTLTAYPLDEGALEWALRVGVASERVRAKASDPAFVGAFSSASQEHAHYETGRRTS